MKTIAKTIQTQKRCELIDITAEVANAVTTLGLTDGTVTVFCPHTTAGVTINENADPDVADDLLAGLERIAPPRADYAHAEGNSDAHIKATLVGPSLTVLVADGRCLLGTWQGIYFCEFDGPRTRKLFIQP